MHNKKVFPGCMIRHGGLLATEAILALAVSVILVQGNKIISGVIDEMLSGRQVLFGSFLLQFLIYTVVGTIAAFLQSAAANRYAVAVCTEYRDLVAEKLYRTEYKYFDANYSATLLNKVIGDLGEITSFLETVLPDMIASLIGIFTYAVYIGETNLGLLMVILITYPLIFWIAGKLVKRIRGLQANYRQKTDVMAQIAQDAVSGILVLRSFGIEDVFRRKMHRASVELVENEEKRTQITNTAIVVRKLIQWLPNIISAIYAVWLVSREEVSLGGLVAFILILSKFVDAYTGLPFAMVDASTGMVSVDRVEKILATEEEPSGEGIADAAVLAAEGVRSRAGKPFSGTDIIRMVRNPMNKGTVVMNRKHYDFNTGKTLPTPPGGQYVYAGKIPAIVSEELWIAANRAADERLCRKKVGKSVQT